MVGRYNSRIRTWEIWNEQNGQDFYKPMPDAEQYVEILKPAYQTVRKVDPTAAESPPSTPTNPSPAKSPTSLRSPSTTQRLKPHSCPASQAPWLPSILSPVATQHPEPRRRVRPVVIASLPRTNPSPSREAPDAPPTAPAPGSRTPRACASDSIDNSRR